MIRQFVAHKISKKQIKWRGHEVTRIEAFSDAVFAFAVTLLIISLEVPKSFTELLEAMRGFFSFAISFLFLFVVWYNQCLFFRRFGMQDPMTIALNGVLLFAVLFFVYPLKFLYSLFTMQYTIELKDAPLLMITYSSGFCAIYLLFALMYKHAYNKRFELELTEEEQYHVRTQKYSHFALAGTGALSILIACVVPPEKSGYAGWAYCLLGPVMTFLHSRRGKTHKKRFGTATQPAKEIKEHA